MKWEKLLSSKRIGEDITPNEHGDYKMTAFEVDHWRIISSASFRRLQDKTQVFPLDKSDFVRTRLTHSIETSSLARQLMAMCTNYIISNPEKYLNRLSKDEAVAACDVAMCAGLLHDIGNPPFGHFGEVVIGDWFTHNMDSQKYSYKGKTLNDILLPEMKNDLTKFEGNAQALRLLTKLHHVDSENGLNLTTSVLNSIIKYPSNSSETNKKSKNILRHKLGYYQSEEDNFKLICQDTGTTEDGDYFRHPIAFVLEAADDIAYGTADIEDACKKGYFHLNQFVEFFNKKLIEYKNNDQKTSPFSISEKQYGYSKKLIDELADEKKENPLEEEILIFQKWVLKARDYLLKSATYGFTYNSNMIMKGGYHCDIFKDANHKGTIQILKDAMSEYVFNSSDIMKLEIAAETILTSLLDKFVSAIIYFGEANDEKAYQQTKAQKKITSLISENYCENYRLMKSKITAETTDPDIIERDLLYHRLLLVTDYISGMTDSYAKNLYQELCGIY